MPYRVDSPNSFSTMPLTAGQKAERRARAALVEGRSYHPRTPANKRTLEELQAEQVKEKAVPSSKKPKLGHFATGMRLYRTRLAVSNGELVLACLPERVEQADTVHIQLVQAVAKVLADTYGLDLDALLLSISFDLAVTKFFAAERFDTVPDNKLKHYATEAAAFAVAEMSRQAEQIRRKRADCCREQQAWEQMSKLRAQAESYAARKLWNMTGRAKCGLCRSAQQQTCGLRCLPHQVAFDAFCTEWLNSPLQ